ncbi:uncharacterized protein YALI1_F17473g [Yarrowia lipolytica]|uniref:Uncharacterized protein n=1 Tax=Yarrowia lipolytica TaxID=4952 RepID=A0A1D8NN94_YARLL|nr:hypothetical protein YALI1_F17473g [Yarrowia lipolytica]
MTDAFCLSLSDAAKSGDLIKRAEPVGKNNVDSRQAHVNNWSFLRQLRPAKLCSCNISRIADMTDLGHERQHETRVSHADWSRFKAHGPEQADPADRIHPLHSLSPPHRVAL